MNGFKRIKRVTCLLGLTLMLGLLQQTAQADPLAETREMIFTCPASQPACEAADLTKKAAELKSAAAMYEYVRNTHEYALYHGSRSNTLNTYGGKRGSDVDIASVLIAMYRSQGIPARYAVADIRAPAVEVANWLGVKDIGLAAAIMDEQGIQHVALSTDRQSMAFEHAWVQVQVPYDNYRGAIDHGVNCTNSPTQCHWIDVDPSYKLRQFHNQGIDIYGVVQFDYTRYYNAIKNDDPVVRDKGPTEIYEQQILDYLKINFPGKTLEDVADPGVIIAVNEGLLPSSLPYQVISPVQTYDSIVEHDAINTPKWAKFLTIRYSLGAFTFTGSLVGPFTLSSSSNPIALADLSSKRITLSYFEGNRISGDPFEHHQMTVRLDGKIIDTPILIAWQNDQAQFLGRLFDVTFELDGAPSTTGGADNIISAVYRNLMFGGYYVIGTGGDTSNWSQVHRAANQLLTANKTFPIINNAAGVPYVDSNSNGVIDTGEGRLLDNPIAQDELTGGLLNVAMTQYYTRFVENTRRLDALDHVISPMEGFVGIVSSTYDVSYLGDTAFSIMPGGLLIDMKGVRFNGSWRNDAPSSYASDHFELLGHVGSSLEHEIWQELTGFDAVSTVRGIQMALANGATLLDLKDSATTTINGMYPSFGFTATAPSAFTLSQRTLYNTQPVSWTHATNLNDQGFDILKKYPASITALHSVRLTYTNGNLANNIAAFDSCEQSIRDAITANGGNTILSVAGTLCGYSYTQGTTLNQLLSGFQTYFEGFFGVGQGGMYDYLDQALGFNLADFTFRSQQAASNIHSTSLVQTIRNALIFGGTIGTKPVHFEYRIPSRKTNTCFNIFSVYLQKIFEDTTNRLVSQSFSISNDSFVAGGGWVDGSNSLSLADVGGSVVKPAFNNALFTDKNLVSQTNNDLIRTPSTTDPVSTVTGNMYHDETDITLKGRGLAYALTRSYNSGPARANQDGPFGFGWTHSYNMSLRSNDYGACPNCAPGAGNGQAPENGNGVTASITYIDERGGEHTYLVNETTRAVTAPPGEFDTLQLNTPAAGQTTLVFRNGVKYVFSGPATLSTVPGQTARLDHIEDAYANRLTLGYDASNRLVSVTDNLGIAGRTGLTFTYAGSTPHIATVSDWSGRTWRYGYDSKANLVSVTNPLNDIVTFTYHAGTHLLNERTLPANRSGLQAKTTFTYYRNNKAFTNANALGEGETLDYDLYRQRTRVSDPRGFIREHFYDKNNGALTRLKEPDGAVLQFSNNADGLRYTRRDGLGFETRYSFQANRSINAAASDNFGRLSRETDALGFSTDMNYGLYDQPTTTVDKRGIPFTRSYYTTTDAASNAVAGELQDVRTTVNGAPNVLLATYTYYTSGAAFGQLKQKIEYLDPAAPTRRRITDYVYEANGINLARQTVTGATSGGSVTTTFSYDSLGRKTSQTLTRRTSATDATPLKLTTTFAYDALGRVIRVTNPRGDIRETVYDANGQVSQEKMRYFTTTPRPGCAAPTGGYVVCTDATHQYDAADRRIASTDILGNTTRFAYDAAGNLIQQTDANGHTTRYEYDAMNRRTAIIDANGYRSEMAYDLDGRLIATTDANGHTTRFTYDALGRQTRVVTPLGFETRMQYDANGNLTHTTDANAVAGLQPKNNQNASVYRVYDELGRVTLERDALNGDTQYTYDLLSNITTITDAEGQVTTFVYDDLGRLIETRDPVVEAGTDKTDKVLLYDEAGNVLLTEDRSGRQRRHTYDTLNRNTLTEYLQDSTRDRYTYDAFGDLVQLANDEITYTYRYTPRHQKAGKTDSRLGKTLAWSYDAVGNVATRTDYQGDVTTYQYDSSNRLVALRNPAYLQVSYHYDGAGRLLNRILSNGAQTDYRYDADNRLIGLKNQSANGTVVEDLSYQHDNVGNITQISNAVNSRTVLYTYDALSRLTGVDSTVNREDRAYTYDKVGNRRIEAKNGTTYVYCYHPTDCTQPPQGNRLYSIHTGIFFGPLYRQFTYDDAGRITQKQDGSGNTLYSLAYNGKGRVTAAVKTGFTFMGYDANDYRVRKNNRLYHLEGKNLDATYDSAGALQNKYLRGVVVDEIVNGYTYHSTDPNDWTNYTFHHDHINSITALTGHTGTVEETTNYDAFGSPGLTLPGTGNDLLFTGRQYDQATGLYYYRARFYDPEIGRFTSEDPLGFKAGVNFYAYVNNNPINRNDPSGNCPSCIGALTSVVLGGAIRGLTGGDIFDPSAIAIDAALGAVGAGLVSKINTIRKFNEINKLTNTGIDFVNSGAGKAFTGQISQTVTKTEANRLGQSFVSQNKLFSFRSPTLKVKPGTVQTGTVQANFESNIIKSSGNFKRITNIKAEVTRFGTQLTDGSLGGVLASPVQSAAGGFVLYPSKPNTNQLQAVYAK